MKTKAAKVFPEIPGESISARRVRYWKWKHVQAKLEGKHATRGRDIKGARHITNACLNSLVRKLSVQVVLLQKALTKAGIKVPQE